MKKTILTTCAFAFLSVTVSAQGVFQWAKNIGTTHNEYPTKICSDNEGNSYVAGAYSQSLIICNDSLDTVVQPPISNQTQNLFISKLDPFGNCIWTKTGISIVPMTNGGSIGAEINDIEFLNGSIYCVGVFTDSMIFDNDTLFNPSCIDHCTSSFILSLDASSGSIYWSKCFEGSSSYSSVGNVIPYDDGVFVSGTYQNALSVDTIQLNSPNSWNYNGYLLKFNNLGTCEWGKNIGVNGYSSVSDMVFDHDKNLYLVGTFSDSIIFPTDTLHDVLPVWARATFFAKYDTLGNFIWAHGGMEDIRGILSSFRLSYGRNGYLYFTGQFSDSIRFGSTVFTTASGIYSDVIVKIDQNGQFIWSKKTGNRPSTQAFPSSIAASYFGFILFSGLANTVVLGVDTVQSNGGLDNLLTQYDFDGNVIYYKKFGGANQEIPKDIYCNVNTTYFVARSMSNYMVDSFPITNVNWGDILIGKLNDTTSILSTIEHGLKKDFQLYPNPSNGTVTVVSENGIKEIAIRNSFGETILSDKPDHNFHQFELTVSGLYFVTIFDGTTTMTKKITVIR